MTVGRILGTIVVVAVAATIALFFFPAAHGSYMSTHGPTTAVRMLPEVVLMWIFLTFSVLITGLGLAPDQRPLPITHSAGCSGSGRVSFAKTTVLRC